MTVKLRASLKCSASQKTVDEVVVAFTLKNAGKEDVWVLPWNTPLGGLDSDCIEVSCDGHRVPYDGRLVKRAPPTTRDFVRIKAGESLDVDVDLGRSYQVSKPGNYEIRFDADLQAHEKSSVSALAKATEEPPINVASAKRRFKMRPGLYHRATEGEAFRFDPSAGPVLAAPKAKARKKGGKKRGKKAAKTPTLKGGSTSRRAAARKAHKDGYALTVAANAGLGKNARYKEWFGAHTSTRMKTVRTAYKSVIAAIETRTFTYDLTGSGCQSSWYAYTYHNSSAVWFCGSFWSAAATGTDSKAGTVLHELTHAVAGTDDHTYGQTNCRQLAKSKPNQAVDNADNYEYHAGG